MMKCELCGAEDPDVLVILPIWQSNGKWDTMACENCAEQSSAWCKTHSRIHQGFGDGTTACISCVTERVETEIAEHRGMMYFQRVMDVLCARDVKALYKAIETSAFMMGDNRITALLRFIVCKALRSGKSIEEIVENVVNTRSALNLFA